MAPELRKRKSKPAVAEPDPVAKKVKPSKATPKTEKRKAPEEASPVAVKKQKPSKDVASSKTAAEEKPVAKQSALKKEKQSAKPKSKKVAEPEDTENGDVPSDVEEEEVDESTKALVKALDGGDDDEAETTEISTFKKGQDVGKVPKAKKAPKPSSTTTNGNPGVMYLARIPHGFYEHELRSYFGQFGDITRLRVVRNKKTGASRHRAFIEFADAEVADIAARTMDKYLLFGHLLSAKTVAPEQVHKDLFKGANRRFKVVPWNKMAGRQLERPLSEAQWQSRISKEEKRRAGRAEKLKAMGYEFEAPALKAAEAKPLLENGETVTGEEEPKAIEAPPAAEETEDKEEEAVEPEVVAKAAKTKSSGDGTAPQKKAKKGRKTKS
ncbi:uncharacterized protein C8A04DRAFT_9738 [Dichotomopilus funicola]|uniref:RRM domain-containing protein n=1 Tax=Dichotomopilus funicola TaxID=1934379 RepID=A0AAN6V7Z1_9PEZI|nr:hypothetical protein C8A04DRAFT_9738 [Dichotomopilus funicola]